MHNWSLPAWAGRLPDGRTYNTCPSAGICHHVCYARHGTYTWPAVRAKHESNLRFVLDDLAGWEQAMLTELAAPKFRGSWIRIHDSGDFFSAPYLESWLRIMRARPDANFYAYTKEIRRLKTVVEPDPPENFLWVYSYGYLPSFTCCSPSPDQMTARRPQRQPVGVRGQQQENEPAASP